MELALQVVGLRMTGRIEDAKQVAQRLVGGSGNFAGIAPSATVSGSTTPGASQRPMAMGFEGTLISFLELLDTDDDADVSSILDTTTPAKQTLLHLAAILGHHRLVSLLLALGADPDVQGAHASLRAGLTAHADRSGYTPLHCAALHGRVAVARLLLGADAAVFVRATDGRTAYELAVDHDQVDIVALFPSRALLLHRRSSSGVSLAFTGADLDSVVSLPSSGSSESDEGSDVERRLSRNVSSRSLSRMGESGGEHAAEKATIVRPAPSAIAAAYSTWLGRLVGAKEMRGTVPMYPPSASTTSSPTKQSARLVARAKLSRQLSPAATDVVRERACVVSLILRRPTRSSAPSRRIAGSTPSGCRPWPALCSTSPSSSRCRARRLSASSRASFPLGSRALSCSPSSDKSVISAHRIAVYNGIAIVNQAFSAGTEADGSGTWGVACSVEPCAVTGSTVEPVSLCGLRESAGIVRRDRHAHVDAPIRRASSWTSVTCLALCR